MHVVTLPRQVELTDQRVELFRQRDTAVRFGDHAAVERIDRRLKTLARDILALNRD